MQVQKCKACILAMAIVLASFGVVVGYSKGLNTESNIPGEIYRKILFNPEIRKETYLGKTWDIVNVEQTFYRIDIGTPKIPIRYEVITVPNKIEKIDVKLAKPVYIRGLNIGPVEPPSLFSDDERLNINIDWSYYHLNQYIPSEDYKLSFVGIEHVNGKQKFVYSLHIYPLKYNPVSKYAIIYRECEYTIKHSTVEILDKPIPPQSVIKYAIITPGSAVNDLQPLAEWKTKKGLRAKIFDLSYVYSVAQGKDNPEKIHNFIHDLVKNNATEYVLLVGDGNELPPRKCKHYVQDSSCPADGYYMCIDGTWDKNNNGQYGEKGDIDDAIPDVAVGRIATTSVSAWVTDTINYERTPVTGSWPTGMTLVGPHCGANGDPSNQLKYYWDNYLKNVYSSVNKLINSETQVDASKISNAINSGTSFLTTICHGSPSGWYSGSGQIYSKSNVGSLTNGLKKPLIYSLSCSSNRWDDNECIGETFTETTGKAAIGYAAATRTAFGYLNNKYDPDSLGLQEDYCRFLGQSNTNITLLHPGKIFQFAKKNFASNFNVNQDGETLSAWNQADALGDPEVPIWTKDPQKFDVTFSSSGGGIDFTVKDSSGNPVQEATVCIWRKSDDLYLVGITDSSGKCTLTLPPGAQPGKADLTVTRPNFIPYESTIDVSSEGVAVNTPNGGEVLIGGSDYTIKWSVYGVAYPVKYDIYLSTDSGSTWSEIVKDLNNCTTYTWIVPKINSNTVRIKVKATDSNNKVFEDTSNNDFTIKTPHQVNLLSPSGGELFKPGDKCRIQWNTSGASNLTIDLFYSTDDGASFLTIVTGQPDTGIYDWTIPQTTSDKCKARVSAVNPIGDRVNATSNKFTIDGTPPEITVITPDATTIWNSGKHRIEYKVDDIALAQNPISISYNIDGGAWKIIGENLPYDKVYDWSVPTINSQNVKIKIDAIDKVGNKGFKESASFTVDSEKPKIEHTPVSSGVTTKPIEVKARITDNIGVTNATLYFKEQSASSWTELIMNSTGDEYNATIPPYNFACTVQYYIKAFDKASNEQRTGTFNIKIIDIESMAKVVGKVIDGMNGQNLEGATVSVYKPGSNDVVASGTSGIDGSYKVLGLVGGTYEVSASKPGYADSARATIQIKSGETKTIDFILYIQGAGSISGIVSDGVTGSKLEGVTVTAIGIGSGTATTDKNGFYRIWGLSSGTYTVTAGKKGYEKVSKDVGVKANEDVRVDFEIYKIGWNYGSISGRVTDNDTFNPIEGAYVYLLKGSTKVGSTETNSTGEYSIKEISPGTYTLKVSKSGYQSCEIEVVIEAKKTTVQDVQLKKKGTGGGGGESQEKEKEKEKEKKLVLPTWFWGVLIGIIVLIVVIPIIIGILSRRKREVYAPPPYPQMQPPPYIPPPYQYPSAGQPPYSPPTTQQPQPLTTFQQPSVQQVKICKRCGMANESWRLSCTKCKSTLGG